jgi:hypothetical protein
MFHFTIRDVLWLTVVVAVLVTAWMSYRGRLSAEAENQKLRATNAELAKRNEWQSQIIRSIPVTGSNWDLSDGG